MVPIKVGREGRSGTQFYSGSAGYGDLCTHAAQLAALLSSLALSFLSFFFLSAQSWSSPIWASRSWSKYVGMIWSHQVSL